MADSTQSPLKAHGAPKGSAKRGKTQRESPAPGKCVCACGLRGCASRRWNPAAKVQDEENRKRKFENDALLDRAKNHYKQWTGVELELLLRDDLTAREIAERLGRTLHGVKTMRIKVKREPKLAKAATGHYQVSGE